MTYVSTADDNQPYQSATHIINIDKPGFDGFSNLSMGVREAEPNDEG